MPRYPNYYLELGGLSLQYLTVENGWAPLLLYMVSILYDEVLFGTDYPVVDQGRVLSELRELALSKDSQAKILGGNAGAILDH